MNANRTDAKSRTAPNRVRGMRRKLRLSQDELAERSGISQASISRIETCTGGVSLAVMCRIAEALNCTISDLLRVRKGKNRAA